MMPRPFAKVLLYIRLAVPNFSANKLQESSKSKDLFAVFVLTFHWPMFTACSTGQICKSSPLHVESIL